MSVVYCPRTHQYFRHEPYPLAKLLAAGINVAIGTDSRASNRMLSVLNEMRLIAATFPAIPPETIIRMGTLNGAITLGRDKDVGTLSVGKNANLAIFSNRSAADPYGLLHGIAHPLSTVVCGQYLPQSGPATLSFEY